jgi:hypothetical protein
MLVDAGYVSLTFKMSEITRDPLKRISKEENIISGESNGANRKFHK